MSRKAGSRDDTNLSLRARSRTQLRQTSGSHTSFSEALFALGKTYAPSRWGLPVHSLLIGCHFSKSLEKATKPRPSACALAPGLASRCRGRRLAGGRAGLGAEECR